MVTNPIAILMFVRVLYDLKLTSAYKVGCFIYFLMLLLSYSWTNYFLLLVKVFGAKVRLHPGPLGRLYYLHTAIAVHLRNCPLCSSHCNGNDDGHPNAILSDCHWGLRNGLYEYCTLLINKIERLEAK
jgi:hypothetical protein